MIKVKGLVHFSVPVSDLDRGTRFYSELLGMSVASRVPHMVFLRFGKDTLILCHQPEMTPKAIGRTGIEPSGNRIHHAFAVSRQDWDLAAKQMKKWGIGETKIEERKLGVFVGRSLYFNDPDGNTLELFDGRMNRSGAESSN